MFVLFMWSLNLVQDSFVRCHIFIILSTLQSLLNTCSFQLRRLSRLTLIFFLFHLLLLFLMLFTVNISPIIKQNLKNDLQFPYFIKINSIVIFLTIQQLLLPFMCSVCAWCLWQLKTLWFCLFDIITTTEKN